MSHYITNVNAETELATVFDLDTGLPVTNLPVAGLTRQEAIDRIELVAADLLAQEDQRNDEFHRSQSMNWRP
jgi:hypothetical protein